MLNEYYVVRHVKYYSNYISAQQHRISRLKSTSENVVCSCGNSFPSNVASLRTYRTILYSFLLPKFFFSCGHPLKITRRLSGR